MAQVVRPQGFVAPLVMLAIGGVMLVNAVPNLVQWATWIPQAAIFYGLEGAIERAAVPLIIASVVGVIGLLFVRGAVSALRNRARGAGQRAREQARAGVQQARQRSDAARSAVQRAPSGWRERVEHALREAEARLDASVQNPAAQPQPVQQRVANPGAPEWRGQGGEGWQGQAPQQPARQQPQEQAQQQPRRQPQQRPEAPGADRMRRIEELRRRIDQRANEIRQQPGTDARRAAEQVRRAALEAASQVGLPQHDAAVAALVESLDIADGERMRRRGSSLTSSSLTTSSLARTSLTTNSLLRSSAHR